MNVLDSNSIRTTTLIPQDQHIEFLCARPTIPAPPETVREWKTLSQMCDEDTDLDIAEFEVGWSDIIVDEAELIDNAW